MFLADKPGRRSILETFVAITMEERLPRAFSQEPIMLSDSPPTWPSTHWLYISAVSMKFPP